MRRVPLADELARVRPDLLDAEAAIASGRVLVDGVVVQNPRSRVRAGCSIVVRPDAELRGSVKLRGALDAFGVDVAGRVALDVGAAAGGFTTVLLERGAARVYAVDAGHGQLIGSLRQDDRVMNLEAVNVAQLNDALVPEAVDVVVVDVSYLALTEAVRQLAPLAFSSDAELVGLVKPMFELRLATAPTDRADLDRALATAVDGISVAGWEVAGTMDSPVEGAGGARELFVHARRMVRT
jgi:23S rRNA (cytidine1920-2'-O)/16S rRNA (cytidine1409-2'-O)-methyltransferase